MLSYTYKQKGEFALTEKKRPTLRSDMDAIVRVTLASICTSDLHIKHGSVPRAVPLITHTYPLAEIEKAYALFEEKRDHVIKVAIVP